MVKEDIGPGYAPAEITFSGFTTTNLHHSADAAKAFQDTIERVGQLHPNEVLNALIATDAYMKINDMHLEQDRVPDRREVSRWRIAHQVARDNLNAIGEFVHHFDYWHTHEHELQDELTTYNPETAGAEMADSYEPEGDLVEELTDKTIRLGDKIKVARVIADMLGVDNAESMSPEVAVAAGLRKIRNKRMVPEFVSTIQKMVQLARDVGVKVDDSLIPKAVAEATYVDGRIKDVDELQTDDENVLDILDTPVKVGHTLHKDNDHVRRMKVKYKTESVREQVVDVDTKVQKDRTEKATKKAMLVLRHARERQSLASRHHGQMSSLTKEDVDQVDFTDSELELMAKDVNDINDIIDVYDDGEVGLVDVDTGEIDREQDVDESVLVEVLSRIERMRAKIRFARTSAKRQRRLQIALHRRSDSKTIARRARRLAIKMLKERLAKKPLSKMTVAEKERVEKMISQRKALIDRLAMRLAPRIRKIENERMSHPKATKDN